MKVNISRIIGSYTRKEEVATICYSLIALREDLKDIQSNTIQIEELGEC